MIERLHLEIVHAISEHKTLTRAAEHLCLTQSALSHSIKKLENRLGTALWVKEGRGLRLSPAGERLLKLSQRILPQLSHCEDELMEFAEGRRGQLRIGMECHPCYQWLLRTVSPFLQQWPDVDVDVKQRFQFGGLGAILHHDIDLLITPDPIQHRALDYMAVFDYELVLVVNDEHPLAEQNWIRAEQLSNETLITYPVDKDRLDIFSQFLAPAQQAVKKHQSIETTDIMLQMVAAGRGVTALPAWLLEQYQNTLPLQSCKLGKQGIHKHIYLAHRKEDEEIDYLKGFIQQAKNTTADIVKIRQ
ncbi:LysR family transcriptional regulator [Pseudoteredinibacter isoporae]|uniref:LysR family transcriptional regulator n=1 Tax=Pseudoteredinibacter isoporae TaxID=570281 RepID=UPI003101D547